MDTRVGPNVGVPMEVSSTRRGRKEDFGSVRCPSRREEKNCDYYGVI